MPPANGYITLTILAEMIDDQSVDTVVVAFTDLYGRFIGKRYSAPFFLEHVAEHGTHACNYLLTVDMEMDPVGGYEFANWRKGYGDFQLVPDLSTLRLASWLDKTALVICDVRDEATGELVPIAPRSILRRQIEQAEQRGFCAMAGSELEYYLFRNSFEHAAQLDYNDRLLVPVGWYLEDYHILQGTRTEAFHAAVRRHLQNSGIPVECTKGEWGLGQHELNVRYDEVLRMADNHAIYKQCLKEVADQQRISVTFMSKFTAGRAGSSCHVHCSLWRDRVNAFAGETRCGSVRASDTFRHFLAGWMNHVPDVMVYYAPTINSYKRFQSGSWAPTRVGWSRDNRTAGFRVVGQDSSLRVECRIPGADCNPYLTYAASLASGLAGIDRRLEPPAMHQGDVYAADELPHVPATLRDATAHFASSEFARHVFGSGVVDHYAHFFRTEQSLFDRAVTDWERKRYFERI
jgi:glutamine synthetase